MKTDSKYKKDKNVTSMKEVKFTAYKFPSIAVYQNPADYPNQCVARIYDIDQPTNIVMLRDSFQEIARDIKRQTYFEYYPPGEDDDKSLVGVWM